MLVGQPPFLANTPAETQYKVVVVIIIVDVVDDVIFILITVTFRWSTGTSLCQFLASRDFLRKRAISFSLFAQGLLWNLRSHHNFWYFWWLHKYQHKPFRDCLCWFRIIFGFQKNTPALSLSYIFLCYNFDSISSDDRRIGKNGSDDIKSHPFFANIDFSSALRTKQAPYKPTIK